MADLATITGILVRNTSSTEEASPWTRRTILFRPVLLDETTSIVDSRTDVYGITNDDGHIMARGGGPLLLWPGTWEILLPDQEKIVATILAGETYTLLGLRGYVPPPGVTVRTLLVPSTAEKPNPRDYTDAENAVADKAAKEAADAQTLTDAIQAARHTMETATNFIVWRDAANELMRLTRGTAI